MNAQNKLFFIIYFSQDTDMSTILGGVHYSYLFDLMLEVKKDGEEFPVYKPGGCCGNDLLPGNWKIAPNFWENQLPKI